jgi:hypothetical protein
LDAQRVDLHRARDGQVLEEHCHTLFERDWDGPTANKRERFRQAQRGVGIFGQFDIGAGYHRIRWLVKRCAGSAITGVTAKRILREVEEPRTFDRTPDQLVVAMTAAPDVKLHAYTCTLAEQSVQADLFLDPVAPPKSVAPRDQHDPETNAFWQPGRTKP